LKVICDKNGEVCPNTFVITAKQNSTVSEQAIVSSAITSHHSNKRSLLYLLT